MKILITGGNGFIAKEIHKYLGNEYDIHCLGKEQLNLLDKESIHRRTIEFYDVIINTAVIGGNRKDVDDETVFYKNILMMENLLSSLNDNQILMLTEQLGCAILDFKKYHPEMNLQKEHYDDVIKCLEYALTGK